MNTNPTVRGQLRLITCAALCVFGVAACNGSGKSNGGAPGAGGGPGAAVPTTVSLEFGVDDVPSVPIAGAEVAVTIAGVQHHSTAGANGIAVFPPLPIGIMDLSIMANGFETIALNGFETGSGHQPWSITLNAIGAWAIGRALVLGSSVVDRASDGSAMSFSLDIAVVGENSALLETLTSADFSLVNYDCGWGGPRDCASDAAGNATGYITPDGGAQAFGLQAASARQPYVVGVLAERSEDVRNWNQRAPALKLLFGMLGGNDAASLASVQRENGATTLAILGPYTSDGQSYFNAIDLLAAPAESAPEIMDALDTMIRSAADAAAAALPGTQAAVLVLATPEMSVAEINSASALARQLDVRINTIVGTYSNYGLPETAVRTGGFVAEYDDSRQLAMILGAGDQLLAGAMPFYRMQFRVVGQAGTFVPGGNAKVWMNIRVPTSLPSRGVYSSFDVAIP